MDTKHSDRAKAGAFIDDAILFSGRSMRPRGRGRAAKVGAVTLIELLVVVAIIAVLVAILLPALGQSRRQVNDLTCRIHLRELWTATVMYADENGGRLPPVPWTAQAWGEPGFNQSIWVPVLAPYVSKSFSDGLTPGKIDYVFKCPYGSEDGTWGWMTSSYFVFPELAKPGLEWVLSKFYAERSTYMRDVSPWWHGLPAAHFLYLDGHVELTPNCDAWWCGPCP